MARQSTRAGGCMLAAAILAGTVLGLGTGEPSKGIIAGTIAGVVIALMVWLGDQRRR